MKKAMTIVMIGLLLSVGAPSGFVPEETVLASQASYDCIPTSYHDLWDSGGDYHYHQFSGTGQYNLFASAAECQNFAYNYAVANAGGLCSAYGSGSFQAVTYSWQWLGGGSGSGGVGEIYC